MKKLAFLFILILSASSFGLAPADEVLVDEAVIARDLVKQSAAIDGALMLLRESFEKKVADLPMNGSDMTEGKIQASLINMIEGNFRDVEATLMSADSEEDLAFLDFEALEKKLEETEKLISEL